MHIKTRMVQGKWSWQMRALEKIDLVKGAAPITVPQEEETVLWKKALQGFVEAI